LAHEPVDVGIRAGTGSYPGLHVERLLPLDQFPVCHPRLLRGPKGIKSPADLRHHTLLHDELQTHWALWLEAHGVGGVNPRRGPVFSDANLTLQAALQGQGVALVSDALTASALARRELAKPFNLPLRSELAYHVVCQAGREQEPAIRAFREWIAAEASGNPRVNPRIRSVPQPPARRPRKSASTRGRRSGAAHLRRSRHARAS